MDSTSSRTTLKEEPSIPKIFSQEYFKLFDLIPSVLYFLCDIRKGEILNLSYNIEVISGYSKDDFLINGLPFFLSIIHPDDYRFVLTNYLKKINLTRIAGSNKKPILTDTFILRVKHKLGYWIWIEISYIVLEYSDGGLGKTFGFVKELLETGDHGNSEVRVKNKETSHLFFSEPNYERTLMESIDSTSLFNLGVDFYGTEKVSIREKQVLQLIAHGHSSKMIAKKLSISPHTVINHRKNLIEKFHAKNTAELVLIASRRYWL